MNDLINVGFFSDLAYGDPEEPALSSLVQPAAEPWEADAVAYLSGGVVIAATMMVTFDEIDPARAPIGGLKFRTDGTFVWPSDLAYYLEHYHPVLPHDFVEHMRAQGWRPPAVEIDGDADER